MKSGRKIAPPPLDWRIGSQGARASKWAELAAWTVALGLFAAAVAAAGYRSRDPDSALYSALAARLAQQPWQQWIAPRWWGEWGAHGLFQEHPAGILLVPALLARLGFPANQAAYVVNGAYQILCIALLARLTARFAGELEARTVAWTVQLIPIAFTYRVRADQEQAVLLFFLLALRAADRARRAPGWWAVVAASFLGLEAVKGIAAVFAPLACAGLLFVRRPEGRSCRPWLWLAAATLSLVAGAAGYEAIYRAATGQSFIRAYLARQLGVATLPHPGSGLPEKAYNLLWYLGRAIFFSLPFGLVALCAPFKRGAARRDPGLRLGLWCAGLYVLLFSAFDRKADRYLFPAYFALATCGTVAALRALPRFRRLAERADRLSPFLPVGLWILLFCAQLAAAGAGLPALRLWPSDH